MNINSALKNLCGPQKPLAEEAPDAKEVSGLLRSGKSRLTDAELDGLSQESRFDLAYNAAHALSLAALRRKGYRPRNRYIVFQVLPHTLGLGPEVWRVLGQAHDARNLAEYEGHLEISDALVRDLIAAAKIVEQALEKIG